MNRTELTDLLLGGENSIVEFKRSDVQSHDLAKDLVAFLNVAGGAVLLGVEDDGSVSGVAGDRLEKWIRELCRTKIEPQVVPLLSWMRDVEPGRDVLAVRVTQGPDTPYSLIHNGRRTYYLRLGGASRKASGEEMESLYPAAGRLRYGMTPVPGATLDALDLHRLRHYFIHVLETDAPASDARCGWETLLCARDLMAETVGTCVATVNGLLLFGDHPRRYLPQSGIRAVCYPGVESDHATRADEYLHGAMAPSTNVAAAKELGLVEQACDFVRRNASPTGRLDGARRIDGREYPESVVREALMNALVHRDFSVAGACVTLVLYANRLEIQSPGRLPGTMTADKVKAGSRHARNQTLHYVMRDCHPADIRNRGVRNRIIPGMRDHNGTEPDLIEEERSFTVRLWKTRKVA